MIFSVNLCGRMQIFSGSVKKIGTEFHFRFHHKDLGFKIVFFSKIPFLKSSIPPRGPRARGAATDVILIDRFSN